MQERGKTIVLITHDPETAFWADSVVHIRDGRLPLGHRLRRLVTVPFSHAAIRLPGYNLIRAGLGGKIHVSSTKRGREMRYRHSGYPGGLTMLERMNGGRHAMLSAWSFTQLSIDDTADAIDIGCGGGANVARLLECT